jgi:hypothetical protein
MAESFPPSLPTYLPTYLPIYPTHLAMDSIPSITSLWPERRAPRAQQALPVERHDPDSPLPPFAPRAAAAKQPSPWRTNIMPCFLTHLMLRGNAPRHANRAARSARPCLVARPFGARLPRGSGVLRLPMRKMRRRRWRWDFLVLDFGQEWSGNRHRRVASHLEAHSIGTHHLLGISPKSDPAALALCDEGDNARRWLSAHR